MTREKRTNAKRVGPWVVAIIVMGFILVQQGYAQCSLATLRGVYIFDATGYNIVNSIPQPKAIVESLDLKGDGTLTSIATVSLNGVISRGIVGSGTYTVAADCTGTLTFLPLGPHFDIFISLNGREFHMIQTDSNTVLAGVSRRVP